MPNDLEKLKCGDRLAIWLLVIVCCFGCSAKKQNYFSQTGTSDRYAQESRSPTKQANEDQLEPLAPDSDTTENWPGGSVRREFEFPAVFAAQAEGSPRTVPPTQDGASSNPVLQAAHTVSHSRPRVEEMGLDLSKPAPWFASLTRNSSATQSAESVLPVTTPTSLAAYTTEPELLSPASEVMEPRVSDTFIETDVREALQSLASQAEARLIVDDQVRGVVTTTIEDQPLTEALAQALYPLGYVYRDAGRVIYVGVPDPESALFPDIAKRYRYSALHRSPEELKEALPERYRKFVRISPQGGWLILEAPEESAQLMISQLEELDQEVPQVILEALICIYSPETNFRFGFDMESGVRMFGNSADVALNSLSLAGKYGAPSAGSLNDFRVTSSFLRALEQKGFVKIRAAPRVMAQDGKQARIHIGRETFFSVQPQTANYLYRQDVQKVSSGIMLEIVPRVRESNVIVEIERAEVSEDIRADETQAGSADRFPLINRRSVSTTVQVSDGETIVIGGLTQRQKVNVFNRVPVLGSIPLAGKLFQRVERQDQRVEVAIFISPRIVKEGCHVGVTNAESSPALAVDDSRVSSAVR